MKAQLAESLPGGELDLAIRRRLIVDTWAAIEARESSGATTWDVLDELKLRVTDLLAAGRESDIRLAERLTAEAVCRYEGLTIH